MMVEAAQIGDFWVPAHDLYFTTPDGLAKHQNAALEVLTVAEPFMSGKNVAIDIGAHIGSWAVLLAERFERVIAFEPHPQNFLLLMKNAGGLDNVRAFQLAIGPQPMRAVMTWDTANGAREDTHTSCGFILNANGQLDAPWAPAMRLDDLALPACDFLKVDVEGLEVEVLRSAIKTIQRHRPVIAFEDNVLGVRYSGHYRGEAKEFLEVLGYREVGRVQFMPGQYDVVMAHGEAMP